MIDRLPSAAGGMLLPPGFRVVALDCVGSTNDEAKDRARSGFPERSVIWAKRQESGRGRRGRAWASPEGNLYASTILRPRVTLAAAAQMSFIASLAIAETAEAFLPATAEIRCKWPNDVLVNGRKIAGILLESEVEMNGDLAWLVLGVGVNLLHFPEDTDFAATSLVKEGAALMDPATVLAAYAGHLAVWCERWQAEGFAPIRAAWLNRAANLGGPVVVRLSDREISGTFAALDSDGVLLLDRGDGCAPMRVAAGDVFFPHISNRGG